MARGVAVNNACFEPERSWLFVPGDHPEKFSKALRCGSDAVILDLEDSVLPNNREVARRSVLASLEDVPPDTIWVRPSVGVSEPGSPELEISKHRGLRGLVLPKVESPDQVLRMRELVGSEKPFVLLIESARGLVRSSTIAQADANSRLCFGSIDFLGDVQATSCDLVKHCLIQLVVASRDAGIAAPIAGVTVSAHDLAELEAQTKDGISLGCFGKLCIHPSQVPVVNLLHRPSQQKIAWANAVLSHSSDEGAFLYEGKMIDAAVLREAEAILRHATRRN